MNIVFDMDNTLVDEFGSGIRPGIKSLLNKLKNDGHTMVLWTSSTKDRAVNILKDHDLTKYFQEFLFREDYDPEFKGEVKDIRRVNGDFLVDDDPKQIDFVKSIKKDGYLITSYRKNMNLPKEELSRIYKAINKSQGFFGKLKSRFVF